MKKRKTNPTSFILDADVREMLDHARSKGGKLGYLCNESLRIYLPKIGFNIKKSAK